MKRSNLKNIANKSGKIEDKKRYKIQRNVVTKLNKKLKKAYFKEKLPNGKDVKDFWNFCKPYFTNKGVCNDEKIILVEKEEVLRKDSKISDTFNNYFVNITDELGIYRWVNIPQNCLDNTEKKLSTLTITQVSKQSKINLGILSVLNLNLFLQT